MFMIFLRKLKIIAVTRNSKYISFLKRVHGRWKCIKTYMEHIFEQIDEPVYGISLIRNLLPLKCKSMIVLNESGTVKYQKKEVEPRD